MTPPNRNALWGEVLIDELVASGLESVCVAPGSRSTPLTVAAYEHDGLTVFSHLDERSASYFALGRARRTGDPVALLCTSGTAAANFHPAVIEANQARVPLLVLTADRPTELRDSGANQTVDQVKLYGDAVRWYRELPEPEPTDRKLRRLRVDAARAISSATGAPAGPVHLNVPFRKPLEPVEVADDEPEDREGLGVVGRDGPFVTTDEGEWRASPNRVADVADRIATAERTLVVAGPTDPRDDSAVAARSLAVAAGAPLLADPLSGVRWGSSVEGRSADTTGDHSASSREECLVCGGYDAYLGTGAVRGWPEPEVVLRVGASPTSKALRRYLAGTGAHQVLVDPAGEWREAEFAASQVLRGDAEIVLDQLADTVRERTTDPDAAGRAAYRDRFAAAETAHWSIVEAARSDDGFEGAVVPTVLDALPERAALFASNSMPVRDLDRFGRPDGRSITALGNRGASGIDGIVSSALGAASVGEEPLVALVGDLAFYHDMNGLLAAGRCGVDATIVVVNNDGGGIFHKLPIEDFDPPFTEAFKTPHGLDFSPTADLYDLTFDRVGSLDELGTACEDAIDAEGLDVLELRVDAEASHRTREALEDRLADELD